MTDIKRQQSSIERPAMASSVSRATIATLLLSCVIAQKNPHYVDDRATMVHLFEWKFEDIADECERFLGPMGYGGVQVTISN